MPRDYYGEEQARRAQWREEYAENFTKYKDDHYQRCHRCNKPLITLQDHFGGGSHYWTLYCGNCLLRFTYGTYDFKLITWPADDKGRWQVVARWNKPVDATR